MTTVCRFDHLLTPEGWRSPGPVKVDNGCNFAALPDRLAAEIEPHSINGYALPACPNSAATPFSTP